MKRGISRRRNETWREAAVRVGDRFDLGEQVGALYDEKAAAGWDAGEAAFHACMDLDCVEIFEPDGSLPD